MIKIIEKILQELQRSTEGKGKVSLFNVGSSVSS